MFFGEQCGVQWSDLQMKESATDKVEKEIAAGLEEGK